eukprot:1327030-Prymnesium_polylepis.1
MSRREVASRSSQLSSSKHEARLPRLAARHSRCGCLCLPPTSALASSPRPAVPPASPRCGCLSHGLCRRHLR